MSCHSLIFVRWRWSLLVLLLALALGLGCKKKAGTEDKGAAGGGAFSPELGLVPEDAPRFVRLDLQALRQIKDPGASGLLMSLEGNFEANYGVPPKEVARIVFVQVNDNFERGVIIRTEKEFSESKVKGIVGASPAELKHKGKSYYLSKGQPIKALHLVDKTTFVVWPSEASLKTLLEREPAKEAKGKLAEALKLASQNAPVVVGAAPSKKELNSTKTFWENAQRGGGLRIAPPVELLDVETAMAQISFAGEMRVQVTLSFPSGDKAEKALKPSQLALTNNAASVFADLVCPHNFSGAAFEIQPVQSLIIHAGARFAAQKRDSALVLAPPPKAAPAPPPVAQIPQPRPPDGDPEDDPEDKGPSTLDKFKFVVSVVRARIAGSRASSSSSGTAGPSMGLGGGSPEEVVRQFLQAAQARNEAGMRQCLGTPYISEEGKPILDVNSIRLRELLPPVQSFRVLRSLPIQTLLDKLPPDPMVRKVFEDNIGTDGSLVEFEVEAMLGKQRQKMKFMALVRAKGGMKIVALGPSLEEF